MPDIFLSYSHEDQATAERFAKALEEQGLSVWWDAALRSGEAFDQLIEEALETAKAVVVLWSKTSVVSRWVRAEATIADRNHTLVPVTIEPCKRPIMFELTQTADLSHWTGDMSDKAWLTLLADLRRVMELPAASPSPATPIALTSSVIGLPDKPSIAVLPFTNMTGVKEQNYFTDGMADEITTALTRFASLFVIANSSTLTYRGETRNLGQIARELGVRYLLEGSVRLSGQRVRIAVKLTDAVENAPLWSERFDGTLEDVFALQDTVANAVAAQIEPMIEAAEIRRANAKPTQDQNAHDLYLRALHSFRRLEKMAFRQALELLDQAITLDPGYALAMALASYLHHTNLVHGWSENPDESRRVGLDLANRALRASDHDPLVLARAATTLCFLSGDVVTADALVQRALAMCPGSAEIWSTSGIIKSQLTDQVEVGLAHLETALRLDPRSPDRVGRLSGVGSLLNTLQRYDEAIPVLREAFQLRPEHSTVGWMLVYSLASTDRLREAKSLASTLEPAAIELLLDATRDPSQRELRRLAYAKVMEERAKAAGSE